MSKLMTASSLSIATCLLTLTMTASAQQALEGARAERAEVPTEEIIVTARRKDESLLEVPQTLTAVSGDAIDEFKLFNFQDITKVVTGISIDRSGCCSALATRGVRFDIQSATFAPTVATYINDAPMPSNAVLQAMYDVGQIEVLKGPQGTLHGISSPSGAIKVTNRRPDLNEMTGTAEATVTTLDAYNVRGALSVPLVQDVLGVRIAGLLDRNELDGVRSVHSGVDPRGETDSARVSVLFQPTAHFSADLMYQYISARGRSFTQVFGPGAPGGVSPFAPANYNGPPIDAFDRRSVQPLHASRRETVDIVTAALEWNFGSHALDYVGSALWTNGRFPVNFDRTNAVLGREPVSRCCGTTKQFTHELRLSSTDRLIGKFEYVVGAFRLDTKNKTLADRGAASFLPGAFGPPGAPPDPTLTNQRYAVRTLVRTLGDSEETSLFGNGILHVTDKLEISAGLRYIVSKNARDTAIDTTPAFIAVASLPEGTCNALGGQFGATYADTCDVPVPGRAAIPPASIKLKHKPTIYSASISYDVSPDLMVYANTASSWREGPYALGLISLNNDPLITSLAQLEPEKSKSYEIGLKWAFADGRGSLIVDAYRQKFDGYIYSSPFSVSYYNGASVSRFLFTSNVPAKIKGGDVELNYRFLDRLSAGVRFSYADGKLDNASIPCNDGNFDGIPDEITPIVEDFIEFGQGVAFCTQNLSTSADAKWNVSFNADASFPIRQGLEGFARTLITHQPRNPNVSETYTTPAYSMIDLFVGVRAPDGKWALTAFARNLGKTEKIISRSTNGLIPFAGLVSQFGPSGYDSVSVTPRREFGLSISYSF